jgi:hypothetical protein
MPIKELKMTTKQVKTDVLKNATKIAELATAYADASKTRAQVLRDAIALLVKGDTIERTLDAKASDYGFWQALKNAAKIVGSGKMTAKNLLAIDGMAELNDPNKIRHLLTAKGQDLGVIAKREKTADTKPKAEAQAVTGKTLTELLMKMTNSELEHVKAEIEALLKTRDNANKQAQEKQAQAKTPTRRKTA